MRIDADVDGALKSGDTAEDSVIAEIFKSALNNEKITIKTENLKDSELPAIIVVDEYMRRYSEMGQYYGMGDGELSKTLIVNLSNPIINKLKELGEEKQKFVANYIYLLALSSYKKLSPEELDSFQKDCLTLLSGYAN